MMEEIINGGIIDAIYKFGALPLLIFAVYVLWNKTGKMEVDIKDLNEAQKSDLRTNNEEMKSIHQNTLNTLNGFEKFIK